MTSEKIRRDGSRLLDYICRREYQSAAKINVKECRKEKTLSTIVRSDLLFEEIEKLASSIDSEWLSMLNTDFPKLSKSNRRLTILLFMRFSTEAIAFLTNKTSLEAIHTAKSRLKKALLTSNPSSFEAIWPLLN